MTSHINYDRRALERRAQNEWRNIPAKVAETRPSRLKTILAYGVVVVGVSVAAFYVTPGHAASTSSIIYLGDKAKIQMRVDNNKAENSMRLETYKSENQLRLEDAKSLHARQLEEDKAYHERLKDQRKGKCTFC